MGNADKTPPCEQGESTTPEFEIRYDFYGLGEPRVVVFKPGSLTEGETIPLSEAEKRGIVSKERAERARAMNLKIREATENVRMEAERGKRR